MKYKPLGNTGLYVSELCFGAMTFNEESSAFGGIIGSSNEAGAQEMVDRAFDAGINFFDTANMYGEGSSDKRG
jgi:aryl-alcohol dehydrogenase-like predicted oxidoreductase